MFLQYVNKYYFLYNFDGSLTTESEDFVGFEQDVLEDRLLTG